VIVLPSGLQYKVLVKGDGEVPLEDQKVQVNYEGRLIDGTVFDASARHGDKPSEFKPNQVIKGWTEALTMMPVGSKWQLFIPYYLAYGNRSAGEIKPYSTLIFDVELVGIVKN
jgi:FKBP-type peptidyl-prolyl cis-trans isomerase FklB